MELCAIDDVVCKQGFICRKLEGDDEDKCKANVEKAVDICSRDNLSELEKRICTNWMSYHPLVEDYCINNENEGTDLWDAMCSLQGLAGTGRGNMRSIRPIGQVNAAGGMDGDMGQEIDQMMATQGIIDSNVNMDVDTAAELTSAGAMVGVSQLEDMNVLDGDNLVAFSGTETYFGSMY
jgi:hypothetical protein